MRICIDARVGWGHGIGRVIANTVPRVATLRPDWTFSALVQPADLERAERAFAGASNVQLTGCDIRPFSLREQTSLAAYARDCDLTWFTNYWVPLRWRGRFVATVHDLLHLMPALAPASRINRALARQTFAKIRRHAETVMFDSRFTEGEFRRIVGAPRHGVTVPLGGDHFTIAEADALGPKHKRLLAVAAPKQHKNFPMLLEAWRRARVGREWTLSIVAPADVMRATIDLEGIAAAAHNVELQRGISNEALATLFATSAIVLTPSLYEGFGLPLLEGLTAGALCVSANAGSMVEVAEGAFVQFVNGRDLAGWVASIEQACATIDRGDVSLPSLRRHNRARAARFAWDRTAADIVRVLDRSAPTHQSIPSNESPPS